MTKRLPMLLTILDLALAIGSILTVAVVDRPLASGQWIAFTASTGDRLVGTNYPGSQAKGVILLEGFGSDQVTMRSLASGFSRMGWHVLTLDFSGHGRSPGALTFDNAQTDRLAYQALSAIQEFDRISGLPADRIYVLGHSLGARVALQAATMNPEPVAGLILLGTQVNLSTNVQSEFFTGTTDADLPWVQALGPENPPVPVLLVSGAWDDILPPEGAEQLFLKLGEMDAPQPRTLVVLPALVHNYEPFSSRVMNAISAWLGAPVPFQGNALRLAAWVLGFAGLILLNLGGKSWLGDAGPQDRVRMKMEDVRRFLWGKLLLWLVALPVAAILGSLFFLVPLGKPVFNLIYVGFIGGYGILLAVLYWRGKMPGVQGRLPFTTGKAPLEWKRILIALGVAAGMLLLSAAYARTVWFYVPPANLRMFWLVIFTPFTALGFWIGLHEAQMLPRQRGVQAAQTLIGLFPFFLYTLLMAGIGSLSGMIGGLQGLLILWLVLTFGDLLQAVGRHPWLTAVCMAVLLYWLILPQGVLF
jgi:alpha-beta hydrolase superfamily lysophospholipase